MADRALKHYHEYKTRLEWFARGTGVKIKYSKKVNESMWEPKTKTVTIDSNMPQDMELAILLHELGHSLDFMLEPKGPEFEKAYDSFYIETETPEQIVLVISTELKAWKYAEKIANRLKITLGDWFYKVKDDCLATYTGRV